MVKINILEGLKTALSKGESLKHAMMSFYNAGYKKQEIEEAAGALQMEQQSQLTYPSPAKQLVQQPQPIRQPSIPQKPQPSQPLQPQPKPQLKQNVSNYEPKPKSKRNLSIIVLIILMVVLLGILVVLFLFKEQILGFFNQSEFFKNLFG